MPEEVPEEETETEIETEGQTETRARTTVVPTVEPSQEERTRTVVPVVPVVPPPQTDERTRTTTKTGRTPKPDERERLRVFSPKPLATGETPGEKLGGAGGPGSSGGGKGTDDDEDKRGGIDLERFPALRASISGVNVVKESVYNPQKSLQKKEKKQKFKVVVMKEGGKKVEIFASSIRGVKRIIYGKKHYKVFNQSGNEMTRYFKGKQK